MNALAPISIEQTLKDEYKARAARRAEAAARHAAEVQKRAREAREAEAANAWAKRLPLWKRRWTHFNDHILRWQMHRATEVSTPYRRYLRDRCEEMNVSVKEVPGTSRRHCYVKPRQLLMWEMRTKFDMSLPEIGRLFGGKDHTTCLWAINKVEAMIAAGELDSEGRAI